MTDKPQTAKRTNGKRIIDGLKDAVAYAKGDKTKGKSVCAGNSMTTQTAFDPQVEARKLSDKLRRAGTYSVMKIYQVVQAAYSAGYAEGHEDQMKARILDARERARNAGALGDT
jgi:hypothetical protein